MIYQVLYLRDTLPPSQLWNVVQTVLSSHIHPKAGTFLRQILSCVTPPERYHSASGILFISFELFTNIPSELDFFITLFCNFPSDFFSDPNLHIQKADSCNKTGES